MATLSYIIPPTSPVSLRCYTRAIPPHFPFRHYTSELLCAWDADGLDFGRANSMRRDTIHWRVPEYLGTACEIGTNISARTRRERDGSTKGDGGSKGLRMNVTINLSLSEEERNSRRCIHIRVSDREWKRLSSKIDAILRYHASCLFFILYPNLDLSIKYTGCKNKIQYKAE